MRELTGKQGMLCVVVLHDLNLARHYCDQIVLMKKGRVVACGKARDILVKDILEDVYDTKIRMVDAGGGDIYILPEMEDVYKRQCDAIRLLCARSIRRSDVGACKSEFLQSKIRAVCMSTGTTGGNVCL